MTETEARNALLAHGVPEAVLDVWGGKSSSSPLRIALAKPDFRMEIETGTQLVLTNWGKDW